MKRREFITLLGGAAATWPLAARAQQPSRYSPDRIALDFGPELPQGAAGVEAFLQGGLRDLGYVEGKNIVFRFRWVESVEQLPELRSPTGALMTDVILAMCSSTMVEPAAGDQNHPHCIRRPCRSRWRRVRCEPRAARRKSHRDVDASSSSAISAKWMEILKEIVPHAMRVGVLWDPTHVPTHPLCCESRSKRRRTAWTSAPFGAHCNVDDFDGAFVSISAGARTLSWSWRRASPFAASSRPIWRACSRAPAARDVRVQASIVVAGGLISPTARTSTT